MLAVICISLLLQLLLLSAVDATVAGGVTRVGWWHYAHTESLSISGNYLYAASGNVLLVIDISDPANPVKRGEVDEAGVPVGGGPQTGQFIVSRGSYVFVAQFGAGLVIVDATDPGNPTIAYRYAPQGLSVTAVAVQGNYLYLATNQGLRILDITNPGSPTPVGSLNISAGGVVVSGDYAYVNGGSTVSVVNISNPSSPIRVSSYTLSSTVYDLAIVNDRLYATTYTTVEIIDVSDPASPAKIGTYSGCAYCKVAVSGNYLYVTRTSVEVQVVDISNPSSPIKVTAYSLPYYLRDINVSGNHLYVAAHYRGVEVVDVSSPASPTFVARYLNDEPGGIPIYGRAFKIGVTDSNRTACVVDDRGMLVFDVSNPANPVFKAFVDVQGRGWDLDVQGEICYAAQTWSGFIIVNVSDPANPQLLRWDPFDNDPSYHAVAVEGNYAYLANGNTLVVYDISNPSSTTIVGQYSGSFNAIAVQDSLAYLAAGPSGLVILNVSNPSSISHVGSYSDSLSDATGVAVRDSLAFITEAGSGYFRIFDVSNPANPVLLGSSSVPADTEYSDIEVHSGLAYVSDGDNGLLVFDVSDPAAPVLAAYYRREDGTNTRGLSYSSGYIYLANWGGGIEILSLSTGLSLVVDSPTNTTYNSKNITIRGSTSRSADVFYSLNGAANVTCGSNTTSFSCWNASAVEGQNSIIIYAGSNSTLVSKTVYFTVDTLPPGNITNVSSTVGDTWANLTWSNPEDADYSHAEIYRNSAWIANVSKPLNYYYDSELNVSTAYTYTIFPVDSAGNRGNSYEHSLTTLSDITPPAVGINSPSNQTYRSSVVKFNITVADASSAIDTCLAEYSGLKRVMQYNSTTGECTLEVLLADGYYTVRFLVNDTSGNVNATEQVGFTVDTSPVWTVCGSGCNSSWSEGNGEHAVEDWGDHYLKLGLFADNFEDNNLDGWLTTGSAYASSGRLKLSASGVEYAYLDPGNYNWTDVALLYSASTEAGSGCGPSCEYFSMVRFVGTSSYYYLSVKPSGDELGLFQKTGTFSSESINSTVVSDDPNTWYSFSLRVYGSALLARKDSAVLTGSDSSIGSGSIGFGTAYSTSYFDDVRVVRLNSSGDPQLHGNYTTACRNSGAGTDKKVTVFFTDYNKSKSKVNILADRCDGYFFSIATNISNATTYEINPLYRNESYRIRLEIESYDVTYTPVIERIEVLEGGNKTDELMMLIFSPINGENYTTFNISISGILNLPSSLSYSINNKSNITLCSGCMSFDESLFNDVDFGSNSLTVYAISQNSSTSRTINFNVVSLSDYDLLNYIDRYARGEVTEQKLLQAIDAWAERWD